MGSVSTNFVSLHRWCQVECADLLSCWIKRTVRYRRGAIPLVLRFDLCIVSTLGIGHTTTIGALAFHTKRALVPRAHRAHREHGFVVRVFIVKYAASPFANCVSSYQFSSAWCNATQRQAVSGVACASASRTIAHPPLLRVNRKLSGKPRMRPLAGWPAASNTVSAGAMLSRSSVAKAAAANTTRPAPGRWAVACICAMHCALVVSTAMRAATGAAIGAAIGFVIGVAAGLEDGPIWHAVNSSGSNTIAAQTRSTRSRTPGLGLTVVGDRCAARAPLPMDGGRWQGRLAAVPGPRSCWRKM